MATVARSAPARSRTAIDVILAHPDRCYWIAALLVYGLAASNAANGHFLYQTSRDLWQHLAALRTLIENPFHPANPFVPGQDGSRHFHPYWVGIAVLARAMGWTAWQALAAASFVSAGTLILGIRAFGLAYHGSRWGPVALLLAMTLGWSLPISHTGFHSVETLVEGVSYPAALLIGLSLLLWALVIRALARPIWALLVPPLAAFMFATHQLGAGIGFVTAGAFILFWPEARLKTRVVVALALELGLALSALWPYHNPFDAIIRTGNPTWTGGIDFYAPNKIVMIVLPSIFGVIGLLHRTSWRWSLPISASATAFALIFYAGSYGILIATRFAPPLMLMLHIGLSTLILILARNWHHMPKAHQLGWFALGCFCVVGHGMVTFIYLRGEVRESRVLGNSYTQGLAITRDIPDQQPVAVWDVAAWPVVATGQRVISVPWPEPMIEGLAHRQAAVEQLFRPDLTREARLSLARHWGVKTLILDTNGPLRREMPRNLLQTLQQQSVRSVKVGMFIRFDLE
ncbi:hypothetical protein [Sphingomonas sp. C3-2]|uniref:hypothetical protein n=1 Tax=Sphingomonas sp. C3-2 TaxID=3062169 RepID=UPI00294ABD4A|nr:hypothetical protein [Sphingomonas sp. C3-2]WOK35347.1 hypothetical protein QYC26_09915 [Sphingomonas sp. C3-2]